jgi:hypothetical protein|uniref:Thoeris anti-defense 2-like domain-containing protein n=1 Tax=Podoviridae sp. ctz6O13 TaxID=2827757 RepID=A0A8S5TKC8_9CAUD|nr:MAG TPA: Protein of unknown function (DUF2829) [Podoviridae sp. ctz6O13]
MANNLEEVLKRMIDEKDHLSDRLERLRSFIFSPDFKSKVPDPYIQFLLKLQVSSMNDYELALSNRYKRMKGKKDRNQYDFGNILTALQCGLHVRRADWDEGVVLLLGQPCNHNLQRESLGPEYAKAIRDFLGDDEWSSAPVFWKYDRKIHYLESWTPAVSDILCSDWEVLSEN